MIRKQIYITEAQDRLLARRSKQVGRSQSELVREAIDRLAPVQEREARSAVLRDVGGLWKDRGDLPDWKALRAESDRRMEATPEKDG